MESSGKREAVIRAALEMVGEHGFHGSPMAQVAERAGVSAGTIYRLFDSKDTPIKEIKASLERQILAAVTEGYPAGGSVRERFLHIERRVIGYFITSPLQFGFLEQYLLPLRSGQQAGESLRQEGEPHRRPLRGGPGRAGH